VDVWVSQAHVMANLMREEMTTMEMSVLLRLHEGEMAIVEDSLRPDARAVGRTVGELALPDNAVLVAVLRGEQVLIPRGNLVLQAGDRVLALTHTVDRQRLAEALG
jgi:trk system potassium uptake protein